MKLERIGGLALAVILCLLSACQGDAPSPDVSPPSPELPAQSQPAPEPPPQPGAESGAKSEPEPGAKSEPEPGTESEPEPGAESEPEPPNTKLYVLMYHHFIREGEEYNDWMLTDVRLREDLEWLSAHGYVTVLPGQLADGEPLPQRAVMLTFDDGYRSNYELAYPLLQEYQAKAVISVIGEYVQKEDPLFLTWDMCREMAQSGLVEIGSHTYASHNDGNGVKRLKGESREEYEARVFPDLQTSVDLIEEHVGVRPRFFAYPYGKTEEWASDFIREHFDVTVITRHGSCDISDGLYSLKRYNMSMETPVKKILPD